MNTSDASPSPTSGPLAHVRFEALDSLRGICAILVVLFHMPVASHWRDWGLIQHAYLFVDYFFVLSGFVIAHAYSSRLETRHDIWRFMVRRLGRVWPLHVLMLVAYVLLELVRLWTSFDAVTPFTGDRSVEAIWTNLLLIQAFNVHESLTWNGPAWTLSVEVGCYVLFAALLTLLPGRTLGVWRWVGALMAIAGALIVVTQAPRWMNTTHDYAFARAIYGFFLGCLIQGFWTRIPRLQGFAATALEIVTLLLIGLFIAWATGPAAVWVTVLFVVSVWVFAGQDGTVSKWLEARPLVTLGRWSFAIYMVHMFVVNVVMIFARKADLLPGGRRIDLGSVWLNDLFAIGLLVAITALAVLAHHLVEKPTQRLVDHWTKPKRVSA